MIKIQNSFLISLRLYSWDRIKVPISRHRGKLISTCCGALRQPQYMLQIGFPGSRDPRGCPCQSRQPRGLRHARGLRQPGGSQQPHSFLHFTLYVPKDKFSHSREINCHPKTLNIVILLLLYSFLSNI